ncbi:MAG: Uma2 family endonuclease [Caldilineaceae bacterium]|nr:Uma2 family endonuclease [Caldilineaceae bacterium]
MLAQSVDDQITTKHPLTVEFYLQMLKQGILQEDDRVELLNGEIFDMSPVGSSHAAVVDRLNFWLSQAAGVSAIVRIQSPIRLSNYAMPEPDVTLLRPRPDFYADAHPGPEDVLLIVEVSDTSLAYDTERKLPAYGAAGIPEVWIVNLNADCIDRHITPTTHGYRLRERLVPGDHLAPGCLADASFAVAGILGTDASDNQ